ncbi:MAG: CRISPR-associated endonuclease Cas3'' [Anaerolineae bacterium]|nr:CRISPR-associated endonuclease Cas3'' [Anaerolineae bacterium]
MLAKESRRLAYLYGVAETPPHLLLWAKADRKTHATHLLLYHMIDVGQVALALWHSVLTEATRKRFAERVALDIERAGNLIAFLVALHDFGKASPAFQGLHPNPQYRQLLTKTGFSFPKQFTKPARHGTISAALLVPLLHELLNLDERAARQLASMVGGHHGIWPTNLRMRPEDVGEDTWNSVRSALVETLVAVFKPPNTAQIDASEQARSVLCTLISGFTSVADWIGSMEAYFPFEETPLEPREYAERSGQQAQQALRRLGWLGWQPEGKPVSFREMFAFIEQPNTIQQVIIDRERDLHPPCLVILEAPTGIGKTEIALYLADRWAQKSGQQGAVRCHADHRNQQPDVRARCRVLGASLSTASG